MRYSVKSFTVKLNDVVAEEPARSAASPQDLLPILRSWFADLDADQEHFVLIGSNNRRRITAIKTLFSGGQSESMVDVAIVFRSALLCGAKSIIVAHNHPSGDPAPSQADLEITRRIHAAGRIVGVPLDDHIILGCYGKWLSLRESSFAEEVFRNDNR